MEPAASIIRRLGGYRAVSDGIGVSYTAPYRWTYPRDRGGTSGIIPHRHVPALIKLAASKGVSLGPVDFAASLAADGSGRC